MTMGRGSRLQATVAAASVMALAACGGSGVTSEYGVFYTTGPDAYDADKATRDLDECLDLDGARLTGGADSLPPQLSVDFTGSREDQRRLEECLMDLPDTRVNGFQVLPSPGAS